MTTATVPGPTFSAEQDAAIDRRDGPLLLAANAGSGKTSVLVERFVRMVADDGLAPGRVLAITFTEKAAGELRDRIRARLLERGLRDAARDAEGAWISTVHGFCARVLRGHAVAAGLDPGFAVLDEPAARALRREAFDVALGRWLGGHGPPSARALDVAAAYGADRLGELVGEVHDELRSQGRPVTLPAAAAPDLAAAAAWLQEAAAGAELALAGATRPLSSLDKALAAVRACRATLAATAPGAPPAAAACSAWSFGVGRVRELQDARVTAYLEVCAAYARARDDAAAVPVLACLDDLLRAFATAYAAAKRARSAVDFSDLELVARDLLRDQPAVAAALRERFARVMVDEFQDTNPLQLELLELLGVDATFVVGDELQSIYGFRHADVEVFRRRRAQLAARGATAELATSFRARPDLLATIDQAFGPGHGPGYVPLVAGRDEPRDPAGRVELLVTDATAWDGAANGTTTPPAAAPDLTAALGAGLDADRPSLAAEARLVAQRVRALVDAGECRAGEVVVLARALRALAPIERALQDLGLATLSGGGRGWWAARGPRPPRVALGAGQPARRDGAPRRAGLAAVRREQRRAGAAGAARPARDAALWDLLVGAYAEGDPRGLRARLAATTTRTWPAWSPVSWPSAPSPRATASTSCWTASCARRDTTSTSCPCAAAPGGWRTSASSSGSPPASRRARGATCAPSSTSRWRNRGRRGRDRRARRSRGPGRGAAHDDARGQGARVQGRRLRRARARRQPSAPRRPARRRPGRPAPHGPGRVQPPGARLRGARGRPQGARARRGAPRPARPR